MKSTNQTKNVSEKPKLTKAVFTGTALVTPICFNPTAEQLRKFKRIPEKFDVKDPVYHKEIKGNEWTKVTLLCGYNPNELLGLEEPKYYKGFISYQVWVADRLVENKDGTKRIVIDQSNQSSWVDLDGKKGAKTLVKAAQAEDSRYKDTHPIRRIDANTARFAKCGEVALHELIFNLSTLDAHRPDAKVPRKLEEFKLGDNPEETFEHICKGEMSSLNKFMTTMNTKDFPGREYFIDKKGRNHQLGVMMTARVDEQDTDKQYQSCMTTPPFYWITDSYTFRPSDRDQDYTNDGLGKSKLGKRAVERLTNEDHPFNEYWSESLQFKEFKYVPVVENQIQNEDDTEEDDDLPF